MRKPIAHGTMPGYKQEIYRKIETCEACRAAWRKYCYERKAIREGSSSQ